MTEPNVFVSVSDNVAHVELDRPDKHNAIDRSIMSGLIDAAETVADDPSVRVVVLSGRGPSFCAGLDAANFGAMVSGDLDADDDRVQAAYADLSPQGA
ncbi:MAG: enoyl-CoA hydratase-related protein, partial [Acidimicrobiia bacterium]|nr:enoyl-CoA hydratase-related protein [Acidimicrobiia bacterium]